MKALSMSLVALAFVSTFSTSGYAGDGHKDQANVYAGLVSAPKVHVLETRIAKKASFQSYGEPANERIVDLAVDRIGNK